jgi:hypothetical protein
VKSQLLAIKTEVHELKRISDGGHIIEFGIVRIGVLLEEMKFEAMFKITIYQSRSLARGECAT